MQPERLHLGPTPKAGLLHFLTESAMLQVYVSDTWQFIYIRQPKASSSSMLHTIRTQLCGGTCKPPHFYQEHDKAKFEAKWASYFVFTAVRNPWTRALSAYSMFNRGVLFQYAPANEPSELSHCRLICILAEHMLQQRCSPDMNFKAVPNLMALCLFSCRTSAAELCTYTSFLSRNVHETMYVHDEAARGQLHVALLPPAL